MVPVAACGSGGVGLSIRGKGGREREVPGEMEIN